MQNEKNESVVLYALLLLGLLAIAYMGYEALKPKPQPLQKSDENYAKALSAQNPSDICATPEGYTDEQWREHMSHHPDQYKECLSK